MSRPGAEHEVTAHQSGHEVAAALLALRGRPLESERINAARGLLIGATRTVLYGDAPEVASIVDAQRAVARCAAGAGTAHVPGDPHGYDARDAAYLLAAGVMDRSGEGAHPAPVLAAAIITAGQVDSDHDALVRATVVGLEILHRVAEASGTDHGWDLTGTAGVIAAAVTAGELRNLRADQISNAIGIAGSSTVGLNRGAGALSRAAHAGQAAANGVLAASLAAAGFTASPDALSAPRGYFGVLFPSAPPRERTEQVLDGLGATWRRPLDSAPETALTLPVDAVGLSRALTDLAAIEESSHR